jgi:polysaccharide deacetylase 2 family uncharacterized protein YibQ
MQRNKSNKIIILVLSVIVAIETILLVSFWIRWPRKVVKVPMPVIKGKIAIVIDDWGYNLNNLGILEQLKYPLTRAVLPNLSYSQARARELNRRGYELILHLPMEPKEKTRLEKNTITTSMDEPTILRIIAQDLKNIPDIKGVSNHMGSKVTRDKRIMAIVFKELKKRGLYFLDSFVIPESICADLADKMQIPFAERDIFLDTKKKEYEYIKKQVSKLKAKANLEGQAIGIGHDHKVTLEVLAELMPEIEKEGYKFVFVSELVR